MSADAPRATRVVVLDDDPTGTQAATDVTVLLTPDPDALARVLRSEYSVYMQTNSRAMTEAAAVRLANELRRSILRVEDDLGVRIQVVLRGDSTLRGHVVAESRVFETDDSILVFAPAFPKGGRTTIDGIHYVRDGVVDVPVGDTEYAADPVFGFRTSKPAELLREQGVAHATDVPLRTVRNGTLAELLRAAVAGSAFVPDIQDDLDIIAIAGAIRATWPQREVVVRAAAPLAAELARVPSVALVDPATLRGADRVLVVCGSHTDGARTQLARLAARIGDPIEVDTGRALADPADEGRRVAAEAVRTQRDGHVYFVSTQRDRDAAHDTLAHGEAVMTALTTAARVLAAEVQTVVTKGGITAAEVVRSSLRAQHARVVGQVQAGVSVWRVTTAAGRVVPCIIVPGNMGEPDVLSDAVRWSTGIPSPQG